MLSFFSGDTFILCLSVRPSHIEPALSSPPLTPVPTHVGASSAHKPSGSSIGSQCKPTASCSPFTRWAFYGTQLTDSSDLYPATCPSREARSCPCHTQPPLGFSRPKHQTDGTVRYLLPHVLSASLTAPSDSEAYLFYTERCSCPRMARGHDRWVQCSPKEIRHDPWLLHFLVHYLYKARLVAKAIINNKGFTMMTPLVQLSN